MVLGRVLFTTSIHLLARAHQEIARSALEASLQVITARARLNAQMGFRSGLWVTDGWKRIGYSIKASGQGFEGEVGSPDPHFAYWELGHYNIYTRNYERFEWLRPAVTETLGEQQVAAARAAQETAGIWASRLR